MIRAATLGLAALLVLPAAAQAGEAGWSFRGRLEAGSRHFLLDRDEGLHDDNVNLEGEVEATYSSRDRFRLRLRPYLAVDPLEPARNRYELLDAYEELVFRRWGVRVGQMVENWAIVDTYNPADVLNRRDLERDFYDPPKLGELMVRLQHFFPETAAIGQPTLSFYVLPLHRESPLPENDDRFRFDITGDGHGDLRRTAAVASPDIAYAARLSAVVGDADVFAFYFGGPGRIPAFEILPAGGLRAVYYLVDMGGVGLQWALGSWLLKLETAYTATRTAGLPRGARAAVPGNYFQYVAGIDRTFTDVLGKSAVTVTLEYAGEDDTDFALSALRPYRSDVFVGVRWEFHDRRRTEILASVAADVVVDEQIYQVDVETALHGNLKLVLAGQFVNRAPDRRPDRLTTFNFFPNNSNAQLTLRYEF